MNRAAMVTHIDIPKVSLVRPISRSMKYVVSESMESAAIVAGRQPKRGANEGHILAGSSGSSGVA